MAELTLRQRKFAAEYALCGVVTVAARRAGYDEGYATKTAYKLLDNPEIKALLDEIRSDITQDAKVTLERMIAETRDDIEFARLTKNANAVMKGRELIAKLAGLLVERHQVDVLTLDLAEATRRAISYNIYGAVYDPMKVIDVTHREVTHAAQEVDPFS